MFRIIKIFPLSTVCSLLVWIVCLMKVPHTPLERVTLVDKWAHIILFFILASLFFYENFKYKGASSIFRLVLIGGVVPTVMGGLIELAQAYLTGGNRSGEWLDFAADAIGAFLAVFIGILLVRFQTNFGKD